MMKFPRDFAYHAGKDSKADIYEYTIAEGWYLYRLNYLES